MSRSRGEKRGSRAGDLEVARRRFLVKVSRPKKARAREDWDGYQKPHRHFWKKDPRGDMQGGHPREPINIKKKPKKKKSRRALTGRVNLIGRPPKEKQKDLLCKKSLIGRMSPEGTEKKKTARRTEKKTKMGFA